MALRIPFFCVKDKQAYRMEKGDMRMAGNPAQLCRDLAGKGAKLIHIVDMDAKRGQTGNMDIYDSLTYFVNIQVECSAKKEMLEKLFTLKARVVLELPAKLDLSLLKEHERLVVGSFGPSYKGEAEGVHDVIIEGADDAAVERFAELGKRVIVYDSDYRKLKTGNRKLVWGILAPI